jgi:flavin-dependent dehydrogenase
VRLFDASHPREKPCGGGLTARCLDVLPPGPPDDPLPTRRIDLCRLVSEQGDAVEVRLSRDVAVASRTALDLWLLRRAVEAGAEHVPERVVSVEGPLVRTTGGVRGPFDQVVGADGANSLVRRSFLASIPASRRMMAAGWWMPGGGAMTVRFVEGLQGYTWVFPRPDHLGVGICAPLGAVPSRSLLERLAEEEGSPGGRSPYAHTIPSPSEDPRSILEIAATGRSLVGDAAGLADPITGEGIYFALRSAELLAETLREEGSPRGYPARVLEDFGRDLLKAAALRRRFYGPGFSARLVRWSGRSVSLQGVLSDLVLGRQPYLTLKRRLLATLPAFLLESLLPRRRPSRAASGDASRTRA